MSEKEKVGPQAAEPKSTPVEAADPVEVPTVMGATFAERAAARTKAVGEDAAENKSVQSSESKSRRSARK